MHHFDPLECTLTLLVSRRCPCFSCCRVLESFHAPVKIGDDGNEQIYHNDGDEHHRNINSPMHRRQEPGARPIQRARKSVRMA